MHSGRSRRGRLRAGEIAEAVVLADLTLVLSIVSAVMPFGGPLLVIAVVPMAALAARNRLRAVIVGTVAASAVGFLVLGPPAITSVVGCGALGAVVGYADRRGFGAGRTIGVAVAFLWPLVAGAADLFLWVFPANRKLALDQVRNGWSGLARAVRWLGDRLDHVPVLRSAHLHSIADRGDRFIQHAVRDWWLTIPVALFFVVVLATVLAQRITMPTLKRVRSAFAMDGLGLDESRAVDDVGSGAPAPVPVSLRHVGYRYPATTDDVLHDVSLDIDPAELVAVVGPNGSGKSTLARVLAGRPPTAGAVARPGAIGLGVAGGTAIVFQRPELQVLGVRVRDDVVWGLPPSPPVDVEALLDRVGLASFADRETSTLSGGELQRLAIAGALARRPQLLISDESTAMVDEAGRARLVALLRSLATQERMAVVHVTHQAAESDVADRVIALRAGRVVPATVAPAAPEAPASAVRAGPAGEPLFVLRDVGHVYSWRTPWAHRALVDVNLSIRRGEAVLVVGHNGSGKSTLAWILAGLLEPSEGDARIERVPISTVVGKVGVAFQHARLQLLRPTVSAEVTSSSGASQAAAWQALRDVGFDPSEVGTRRVDELSGGQARRVVLASALAARPLALVLDEPFAGLDESARADLAAALTRLRVEHGMTLVCVSHDRDLPAALVDREIELTDGRITYDGPGRIPDLDAAGENHS